MTDMPNTGLILESYRFKDISHERVFGSVPSGIDLKPFEHDVTGIPVVFQGTQNTCVACTITWIRQWMEKNSLVNVDRLSWPFLAKMANIGADGAAPSQVLEPARKTGICKWDTFIPEHIDPAIAEAANFKIPNYSFLTDYSKSGIYSALQRGPLAAGVVNWKGVGDHMMAVYGMTENGWKAKSWWDADHQTDEVIAFDQIEVAISFAPFPANVAISADTHAVELCTVFWDKISMFLNL